MKLEEKVEKRIKELENYLSAAQGQLNNLLQQRNQLDAAIREVSTRIVSIQGGIAELQLLLENKEPEQ